MTSSRLFRSLKSGIAVLTSGSMLVVSAVSPVAAQTYRAVPGAGGSSARAIAAPVSSIPSLPASVVGSAGARFGLTTAPSAPAALSNAGPAALNDDAKDAASQPAAAVKPQSAGAANAGPRWVAHREDAPKRTGPRWVAPKAPGLRAALFKILPFLGDRPGDETFDGAARQPKSIVDAPAEAPAPEAGARLSPARAQARIIEDHSIATPEAARRVGALRHAHGAPAWVKVAAPVSLLAAAAVAVYSGAALTVPVLTLGAGLVLSVLAHEVAHVAMLRRLGDRTAEHAGSHSLNPFHHIDGVKTVLAPALSLALSSLLLPFPVLIGAGKPVDADFNNLRGIFGGPRSARNAFWVAAAGPATNILLAGAAYGAFALLPAGGAMAAVAFGLAKMNLALTVFNLLPFPQLDGGKMLASALPERFYAKWVFNPKVEKTYQGILRRLYQGPSNILTWLADRLGVRTQTGINRLANATTFAALAAFYAVAYFQFSVSVPLLFLALPCSYDYWCIREKVRSEAAVNSLMGIMGEWGSLISQISREKGLESEVSAYEAEHAMKNALETLVDEMMAKPEFRALPDADKLEAFMKAYPEKAAEYLREKAITEDSLEQIRAILSDPRNGPFYERLKKWFTEHEIFSRWDNAHDKEKLKDALDEADKPKESGIGGAAALAIVALGLGALGLGMGFPGWAPQASALLGGIGAFGMLGALGFSAPDPSDGREKVAADTAVENNQVIVRFKAAAEQVDVDRVTRLLAPVRGANAPELERAGTITAESQEKALQIAALAAPDAAVESIAVSAEAFRAFNSVPWQQKIVGTSFPNTTLRVIFASPMAQEQAETFLASYGRPTPVSDRAYTIYGADAETIAEMARALADDHRVTKIMVSGLVQSRLTGIPAARQNVPEPVAGGLTPDASMPAAAAPAPVPAQPPAWFGKAVRKHSLTESVRVVFASGTSVGDMRARLQGYPRAQSLGGVAWEIPVLPARAAAVARHFAEEASVIKIILSPAAYAQLKRAAANPAEPSAPEEEPEAVPQTPSEAPTPQAPAAPVPAGQPDFTKVFLRGGENGALNVLFKENVPTARREEILALSGGESVASDVRSGGEDVLSYEGGVEVRDAVVLLSKFSEVEALGVSLFNYETLVDHRARAIDNARRKIVLRAGMRDLEIRVVLRQSVAASLAEEMMNVYRWTRVYGPEGLAYVAQIDDAAKMARLASHFAQDPRIVKVVAPKGFEIPGARVDEAASFAPMNATSHGKAEYAQNVVFVKFAAGTPESVVKMILAKHGQNVLYYHGDQLTVHTPSAQAAAAKAVALSAEPTIESVQVHANAVALLTGEAPP
ncbi:MAG: hypothetical protein HYZ74_07775, partial [Elusimicrobia bacterium]|nr:hypothetical protein [Elusimicrobiota bacterium]